MTPMKKLIPLTGEDLETVEFLSGRCDGEASVTEDLGQLPEGNGIRVWCAEYPEEGSELLYCPYGIPIEIIKKDDKWFWRIHNGKENNT